METDKTLKEELAKGSEDEEDSYSEDLGSDGGEAEDERLTRSDWCSRRVHGKGSFSKSPKAVSFTLQSSKKALVFDSCLMYIVAPMAAA